MTAQEKPFPKINCARGTTERLQESPAAHSTPMRGETTKFARDSSGRDSP